MDKEDERRQMAAAKKLDVLNQGMTGKKNVFQDKVASDQKTWALINSEFDRQENGGKNRGKNNKK